MPDQPDEKHEPIEDVASVLKSEWTQRSKSERARFYIASHPGWQEEEQWNAQARTDAGLVLLGISEDELSTMDVLEIGCGNGRLVPHIAPRVKSYSGFDICGEFIRECRTEHSDIEQVRFAETEGSCVPPEFESDKFDLVFAAAVFIHCPIEIIGAYFGAVSSVLKSPSRFRFQVLTDPEDLSEIIPVEMLDPDAHKQASHCHDEAVREQLDAGETELVEDSRYQGYQFRMDELRAFLAEAFPNSKDVHLIRFDPLIVNCEIVFP